MAEQGTEQGRDAKPVRQEPYPDFVKENQKLMVVAGAVLMLFVATTVVLTSDVLASFFDPGP
ncbi:hypothetical protein [Arthrobacter sp. H35-D1]|uniref:hypothetical protein n=1 Tax=Arthrobacter sp. H35-D1 TaxID=3046202 RepID=UPI0024BA90DC|nr:hypothetical protein [Arthrobacter sp. H35-D1]MDJ0312600.1 hypothetical protein [Arthrobacter sp. H35-D1]